MVKKPTPERVSPAWITVAQYAAAMQLSEDAVRRHIRQKRIKARNVGTQHRHVYRIPASELDAD